MTTLIPKYDQNSTGAVNRPFNEKLNEFVSVLDFGADSTGATDSSTAFTNALATGKAVFVPKGIYKASFTFPNGQILYGEGSRNCSVIIPPSGATYVIKFNSASSSLQHCVIKDLSIENSNNVSNCYGIWVNGTDYTSICDNNYFENLYIYNFNINIYVTGRLILNTFINVELDTATTKCMSVLSDTSNFAFNTNQFITCRFLNAQQEGFRLGGLSLSNNFLNCDFETNNLSQTSGIAGVYFEEAEMITFQNCYFENNGASVSVDTGNYLNNSFGLHAKGSIVANLKIDGCWMVGSGVQILIDDTSGLFAGSLSNTRFAPTTNGWDFVNAGKMNAGNTAPFVVYSNNYWDGLFLNVPNATTLNPTAVIQSGNCQFLPALPSPAIDLRTANKFVCNNASGFTISTINNMIPGMELWINNNGSGTITIASGLMANGVASNIATNVSKIYMVSSYPAYGLLIEM